MAEDRLQRRLAAILSADVVGYSRLMGEDEARTLSRLNALRRELIDPAIAAHAGRIVKLMGDGALVEFGSAVNAVACAIDIQRRLREAPDPLQFRIGVHVGDVIVEGDDILGDGVNIAARIEGVAEPGGVSISEDAWRHAQGKVSANFVDAGEHTLKNIARPVRIYRLAASPSAAAPATPAPPERPSIAVLAFTNMSGDPEQEYFSDGISEDIITDLSKASELLVIARNSSFTYKGKPVDVKQVGRELGVRYVLEGSVRKAGARVRVTGQLIDASNGAHIWADRFDRDLTDIFAVQDEVTREIISALKIKLTERERTLTSVAVTKNPDAHDLFLKGRGLLLGNKRDHDTFRDTVTSFQRAIELDPNYAAPYAGLAFAHHLDYQNHWSDDYRAARARALSLIEESLARDDQDPFARTIAALIFYFGKDFERAAREADAALALNPNYSWALNARGTLHLYSGEPAGAISYIERAIRLDPAQHQQRHFLGAAYFGMGQYETAAAMFKERIATTPNTDLSRAYLVSTLGHLGRVEEAHEIWRELMEINPKYSYSEHVGRLPFKNPADAERIIEGFRKAGVVK